MIKKIIKSIFCKHDYKLIQTIHGDQVNHLDARSQWQCEKCKWITYSHYLDRIKQILMVPITNEGTTFLTTNYSKYIPDSNQVEFARMKPFEFETFKTTNFGLNHG